MSRRLTITDLPLAGLKLIERDSLVDARGFLSRLFCADELAAAGWRKQISQINHTSTARRGTVRGMHFQHPPYAEMKLVSCLRGRAWDVAVDIRRGSNSLLRWHAEELSADNHRALLIPEGFAHGFQALTDDVELVYCHSVAFRDGAQGGLNPRDARLAIEWPLDISVLSEVDDHHPMIHQNFSGIVV